MKYLEKKGKIKDKRGCDVFRGDNYQSYRTGCPGSRYDWQPDV
jgi:hypothetical protein